MTTHPAKQDNRKLSTAITGSGMRSLRCRSRRSWPTPKHHVWHGPLLSGRRRTYHSWAGPVWLQAHHRRYQFFLRQPPRVALVLTGIATTEQPKRRFSVCDSAIENDHDDVSASVGASACRLNQVQLLAKSKPEAGEARLTLEGWPQQSRQKNRTVDVVSMTGHDTAGEVK